MRFNLFTAIILTTVTVSQGTHLSFFNARQLTLGLATVLLPRSPYHQFLKIRQGDAV